MSTVSGQPPLASCKYFARCYVYDLHIVIRQLVTEIHQNNISYKMRMLPTTIHCWVSIFISGMVHMYSKVVEFTKLKASMVFYTHDKGDLGMLSLWLGLVTYSGK